MENYENYQEQNVNQENVNQTNVNPVYNNDNQNLEEPVSLGEWLVSLLLLMIPCANIVLMFVWAFGKGKESKRNFFKAYLIYYAITIVLVLILWVVMFAIIGSAVGMYY